VLFQNIVTIAPPSTISEGAIDGTWEERTNVMAPFFLAEELLLA